MLCLFIAFVLYIFLQIMFNYVFNYLCISFCMVIVLSGEDSFF